MADTNGGFDAEQGSTTSYSQMLFSDDLVLGLDFGGSNNYSCSSAFSAHEKPPRMLCFGDYSNQQHDGEIVLYGETITIATPQKSGITCSDSSSASSGNNTATVNYTPSSKSTRKRNGSGKEDVQCPNLGNATSSTTTVTMVAASQRSTKKTKAAADDNPSSTTGHAKSKKEKLGDRITALQQLVSPFGKTDTASVLHEAMGYIRFLQDQVQVLCSPYLQHHHQPEEGGENGGEEEEEESGSDLKSRGLCLVPVACTVHVANSNGADFWSPAAMGSNVRSSSSSAAAAAAITRQQLK